MRTPFAKALGIFAIAAIATAVSCSSVSAKANSVHMKYSVVQQGQAPSFTVTNNTKKARAVDIELRLSDSTGRIQVTQTYGNQTIAPGSSQAYSLGQLFLTPAYSPYRIVASIYRSDKKHRLIETVDPAGTFTVAH